MKKGVQYKLTADYCMFQTDEQYVMKKNCNCGSNKCRKTITGKDWRNPILQVTYKDHFSPFLNERIKRLMGFNSL